MWTVYSPLSGDHISCSDSGIQHLADGPGLLTAGCTSPQPELGQVSGQIYADWSPTMLEFDGEGAADAFLPLDGFVNWSHVEHELVAAFTTDVAGWFELDLSLTSEGDFWFSEANNFILSDANQVVLLSAEYGFGPPIDVDRVELVFLPAGSYTLTAHFETNVGPTPTDIGEGGSALLDHQLWFGPLERPLRLYVDDDAPANGDGLSWATAFQDLHTALDAAMTGAEIWVAEGNYTSLGGPFRLASGVALYGGFAGDETNLDQRDWRQHRTNLRSSGLHIILADAVDETAVLDGFAIRDCEGGWYGGAIRLQGNATPLIRNCEIIDNIANHGAGIYRDSSSVPPRLFNCVFRNNHADRSTQEPDDALGGAIYSTTGGAIELYNCLLVGNTAERWGAIRANGPVVLVNCTVAANRADAPAVAIGGGRIVNSILWGNLVNGFPLEQLSAPNGMPVTDSCIQNGWSTSGAARIITSDPKLTSDWRLGPLSSCVDRGDGNALLPEMQTDLAGQPRSVDEPAVPNAGIGTPDYVDLGAYEFALHMVVDDAPISLPEGQSVQISVALNVAPTEPLTVTASIDGDPDITISGPTALVFDHSNYMTPQSITVSAAEDADFISGAATLTLDSPTLWPRTISIAEVDNDFGLIVTGVPLGVPEGGSASFAVSLSAPPIGGVAVFTTKVGGDGDLYLSSGLILVFDPNNFDQPQMVTISAAEDTDLDNGVAQFRVAADGTPAVNFEAEELDNDLPLVVTGEERWVEAEGFVTRQVGPSDYISDTCRQRFDATPGATFSMTAACTASVPDFPATHSTAQQTSSLSGGALLGQASGVVSIDGAVSGFDAAEGWARSHFSANFDVLTTATYRCAYQLEFSPNNNGTEPEAYLHLYGPDGGIIDLNMIDDEGSVLLELAPGSYAVVAFLDVNRFSGPATATGGYRFMLTRVSDCPGDLTGDGRTDLPDLSVLLSCYGHACGDLTGDSDTSLADLGVVFANWNCGR